MMPAPILLPGFIKGIAIGFSFREVCKSHGVDPEKTSYNDAQCLYFNIPVGSSLFDIECAKFGLDPKTTSHNDLDKAGSQHFKPFNTRRR